MRPGFEVRTKGPYIAGLYIIIYTNAAHYDIVEVAHSHYLKWPECGFLKYSSQWTS